MAKRGVGMQMSDMVTLERTVRLFAVRLPAEGDKVLKDTSETIARQAKSKLGSRPGSRGKYKRMPQDFNQATQGKHHGIEIERGGTAIAAEYGATFHHVFGNRIEAKKMKRRVFGARVKRWTSGKVVGKTVKADLPRAERALAKAFDHEAEKLFTKAGL